LQSIQIVTPRLSEGALTSVTDSTTWWTRVGAIVGEQRAGLGAVRYSPNSPIRGLLGDADLDERAVVAGRGGEPALELRHSCRLDDEIIGAGLERLGAADLVIVARS